MLGGLFGPVGAAGLSLSTHWTCEGSWGQGGIIAWYPVITCHMVWMAPLVLPRFPGTFARNDSPWQTYKRYPPDVGGRAKLTRNGSLAHFCSGWIVWNIVPFGAELLLFLGQPGKKSPRSGLSLLTGAKWPSLPDIR